MVDRDDDLDDVSEEELAVARELAARLDDDFAGAKRAADSRSATGRDSTERNLGALVSQTALLKGRDQFDPDPRMLRAGRARVLELAAEHAKKRAPTEPARAWWSRIWLWAPLPAVILLALGYGMSDAGQPLREAAVASKQSDASDLEQPTRPPESAPPSPDADASPGGARPPSSVLRAQATLLAAKAEGKADARAEALFEEQMRGYRAQLLARLDP